MRQYVLINGYRVGLWRCPHCFRGVKHNNECLIHGIIDDPINVLKSDEARKIAMEIRQNTGVEKITHDEFVLTTYDWNKRAKSFLEIHGWEFIDNIGIHELFSDEEIPEDMYEDFCRTFYEDAWNLFVDTYAKALLELDKFANDGKETILTIE